MKCEELMKRFAILLLVTLGLFLTGCSNEFAKNEYDDLSKIVANNDRYTQTMAVTKTNKSGFSLEIGGFDGRYSVFNYFSDTDCEMIYNLTFELGGGTAKLIFVDAAANVVTLAERKASENDAEGKIIREGSLQLRKGRNSFKLVGYDVKNVKAEFSLSEVGEIER